MTTKAAYEVQRGKTRVDMPHRRIAMFVTNNESTHVKSENHPDKILPMVFDTPEMVWISDHFLNESVDYVPMIEIKKFASSTATPLNTAMLGK